MKFALVVAVLALLVANYRVPDVGIATEEELPLMCAGSVFKALDGTSYYGRLGEQLQSLSLTCTPLMLSHQGMVFTVQDCGDVDSAETLVLLHGFPDLWTSWVHQIEALTAEGYRVIVPTMRGYEPSSTASGDYHLTSLAQDVACHLHVLGIQTAHVVGHDWGSSVAEVVSTQYESLVKSVTGLAVPFKYPKYSKPNAAQLSRSWYMFYFQLPLLPELTTYIQDFAFLDKLYRDWSPTFDWATPDGKAHIRLLKDTFGQPHVLSATIGYYRHNIPQLMASGPLFKLTDPASWRHHPTFGLVSCPVLMISGADDGCIGSELFDSIPLDGGDFQAGATFRRVADAGHFVQYEQPEAVNEILLQWLATL